MFVLEGVVVGVSVGIGVWVAVTDAVAVFVGGTRVAVGVRVPVAVGVALAVAVWDEVGDGVLDAGSLAQATRERIVNSNRAKSAITHRFHEVILLDFLSFSTENGNSKMGANLHWRFAKVTFMTQGPIRAWSINRMRAFTHPCPGF